VRNWRNRSAWRCRSAECVLGLVLVALGACASVEPWQKGKLAQPGMALDFEPLRTRLDQQVYQSKEAARGGDAAGGGGCGCN